MHRLQELVRLHRMGTGYRDIARLLGMSPNTERQYRQALAQRGLLEGDTDKLPELDVLRDAVLAELPPKAVPQQQSSIDRWREAIEKMLERGATPTAIYDRLRLEHKDFDGSLSAVKRMCLRIGRERGVEADDVAIPVETAPGEVAQVDFGYVGYLYDPESGRLRKAWVFVLVLGYSRHMVCRIVFDQKIETWLRLHVEAFAELGGVPAVVVPDNLKAAVIRAAFSIGGTTTLNRSYRELARFYGFQVDPTPARSPEKKGKVESAVKYVKRNFFKPRDETSADALGAELCRWVREIAGQRRHGTTGKKPLEVFEAEECAALKPLPTSHYQVVLWREPKVHPDAHVLIEKALYSVPWPLVGKQVLARVTPSSVAVYYEDQRVATHERVGAGSRATNEEHLPPGRRDLRHRGRAYWEKRADALGDEVGAYIREVFDSDDVLYQLRTVQQIVTHLETFPPERARAACVRATYYGNHTYGGIKNILRKALDQEPLPTALWPEAKLENPRFARDIRELIALPSKENSHASN